MARPICNACNRTLAAINYIKDGAYHYRSRCDACVKKNKQKAVPEPRWRKSGYKKKMVCDLCGFKAQIPSQIVVYHCDGNLNNCQLINLRSICLCCVEIVKRNNFTWRVGDIVIDR